MSYVVHVTMTEERELPSPKNGRETVHVDGTFKYQNLELAREAAEVACHAAEKLHPAQSRTIDDDDWSGHPDRSD